MICLAGSSRNCRKYATANNLPGFVFVGCDVDIVYMPKVKLSSIILLPGARFTEAMLLVLYDKLKRPQNKKGELTDD